jgi:hypothetical protein
VPRRYPLDTLFEYRKLAVEKAERVFARQSAHRDLVEAEIKKIRDRVRLARERITEQENREWEITCQVGTRACDLRQAVAWRDGEQNQLNRLLTQLADSEKRLHDLQQVVSLALRQVTDARQQYVVVERHRETFERSTRVAEEVAEDEDATEAWQVRNRGMGERSQ